MRIGIDARMYGNGQTGIGNYIKNLLENIFNQDSENEYVIFLLPEIYQKFICPNERVKKVVVDAHWYTLAEQWKMPLAFYREKLDLLHIPHFNTPLLYFGRQIVTIHDITPKFFPGHKMNSRFRRLAFDLVFKNALHRSCKIIAVSEFTKQGLVDNFRIKPEKIAVTYEAVDDLFFNSAAPEEISSLKAKHQIAQPYFLYVGVWRNHKNLVGLIKGFKLFKDSGRQALLVLCGKEDPHYPEVRQTWESLGLKIGTDLILPGFVSDAELPLFYQGALALAIPSFIEGFGLIGLEAAASRIPVLASNTTSLPEIMGEAALFFNPDDPSDIFKQMRKVFDEPNLRQRLIEDGLTVSRKYSWAKCAEQTLMIYQKVARK